MAMGAGITMMGRGADIDPETLKERERLANMLYQNSLAPQQPERSWTQGLARVLQSGVAGYEDAQIKKDKELYNQQRASDMQLLSAALQGEDYQAALAQLKNPEMQKTALQLALADKQYQRDRADKQADREDNRSFELKKFDLQRQYDREKLDDDPIKSEQRKLQNYARVANDPNAPPQIREMAQAQLAASQKTLAAMSPPKTSVNVDASQKSEDSMIQEEKKARGKANADTGKANIDLGISARDNLSRYNTIEEAIGKGELTNLNTTSFGQGLQVLSARLGLPNDTAKISDYIQAANNQLVEERKRLAGQGVISDRETAMLQKTVLDPNDTMEATRAKLHLFKQYEDRKIAVSDMTRQWIERFGSISAPAPNGQTYQSTLAMIVDRTPLTSYEEEMRKKADAASQAAGRM